MSGLSKEMRKLVLMNISGQIVFLYVGIFINLFIWEKNQSLDDVALYNLFLYLSWGAAFTCGAHLLMKYTIRLVFALSGAFGIFLFVLLSFVPEDRGLGELSLIGVCAGLTFGLFYSALNLSQSLQGDSRAFGAYFSTVGALQQAAAFLVPLGSALVIQGFGYGASFLLMLIVVGMMLGASYFLPPFTLSEVARTEGKWYVGMGYRTLFPSRSSKWLHLAILTKGLFFQFQNLFLIVFTFQVTENKLVVGLLNCGYTLSAFAALYFYKRIHKDENSWMLLGLALAALGFLAALLPLVPLLIVSNVFSTVGMYYFGIQWHTKVFRTIASYSPMAKMRILIWRELSLVVSRCSLLLVVLAIHDLSGGAFVVLVLATICSMYGIWVCFRQSERLVQPPDYQNGATL